MGGCFSSDVRSQAASDNVRIVHMNGLVEDFEPPVFVDQLITSKTPRHFIITPSQLLSPLSKPLHPNAKLEPGQVYFLLPYATLQPDVSPANLTTLVKQLMKKANSRRPGQITPSPCSSPGASPMRSPSTGFGQGTYMSSPGRSPIRFYEQDTGSVGYKSVKGWRPLLDTINERSFNRRSESDLQERYPGKWN